MRGRKPQPVQVQVSKGDPAKRGKGVLNDRLSSEPRAARGLPDCPKYLSPLAAEAWVFFKESLEGMRLAFRPDAVTLQLMCIAYQKVREAYQSGDDMQIHKAIRTLASLVSEFGLSPVSRTRITIEKKDDEDADLDAQLKTPRSDTGVIQ